MSVYMDGIISNWSLPNTDKECALLIDDCLSIVCCYVIFILFMDLYFCFTKCGIAFIVYLNSDSSQCFNCFDFS